MIVRLSGPRSWEIACRLCPHATIHAGRVDRIDLHLRQMILPAIVYAFELGRSYTGQTLIEIHLPGNPLLCRLLLAECSHFGARLAEPGEFTARAYFNGRINLTEAEGIAASIASQSAYELRAARQLMAGELARQLQPTLDLLAETLALVEAGIDFAGEEISILSDEALAARISKIQNALGGLLSNSRRMEQHWRQRRAVLVGRPNAGKSTLLNALAKSQRAVVSSQAGTTRDVVSADVALRRGIIQIVDVAGLEDVSSPGAGAAGDIARQMQSHAQQALQTADWVLLVQDLTSELHPVAMARLPDLVIHSKRDLAAADYPTGFSVSAHSGYHLDLLRDCLDQLAFGSDDGGAVLSLGARHIQAIGDATAALSRAHLSTGMAELVAADLREALDSLGSILGQITPDDVLGRVFSNFCIGK